MSIAEHTPERAMGRTIDPAEVRKFADIADEWWDPKGKFAPLHRMNPARLAFLRDEILRHFSRDAGATRRPLAGLKIIDVGCGGGLVTEPMARMGASVTGLDAAPEAIAAAGAHAGGVCKEIAYKVGTAESLVGEAKETFDVVLALEIVEHVADLNAFLVSCAALVKPGGLLIVSTINRTPEAYAFAIIAAERILRWLPVGSHAYDKLVKPEELHAALNGLMGLDVRGPYGLVYKPLTGKWETSLDARINYFMTAAKSV
jgi:2-polyprenyl-6-hydroxyphenyl methylase/3-demethylubiquinone-9 3-methyltransferase